MGEHTRKMSQMEEYRKDVCNRAKVLLQATIPEKLVNLDEMLQTERLKTDYCDEARQFAVDSLAEYEKALKELEQKMKEEAEEKEPEEEDDEEDEDPPSKKAKASNSKLSIGLKSKTSTMDATPKFPVNEKIMELAHILKPELIELSQSCQLLKDWILLHVPKHEDGNNFGVEVQEDALNEVSAVKDEALQTIEEQSAYHLARANIVEKIIQEGNVEDLKVFIYDEDEKQCRRLRNVGMSLRTNYTTILDLISKNYERIIHPKGYNPTTSMY